MDRCAVGVVLAGSRLVALRWPVRRACGRARWVSKAPSWYLGPACEPVAPCYEREYESCAQLVQLRPAGGILSSLANMVRQSLPLERVEPTAAVVEGVIQRIEPAGKR